MSDALVSAPNPVVHWLGTGPRFLVLAVAAFCGAIGALGQAPFDHPIAMVVSLTFGFGLWRAQLSPRAAAWVGWAFASAYFALALFWIIEPFQVDAARHGWMAPFALLFLSTGLALFWAAAFWLARRVSGAGWVLIMTWTGAEILRAYAFTGFPWAAPAQSVVDGHLAPLLAWMGPHGVTLVLLVLAWALSMPALTGSRFSMRMGQTALLAGIAVALYLPPLKPASAVTGHWVRLIQPNAAQHLKWQPDMAEVFYQRQLRLASAQPLQESQAPDLIVWPETSIPWRLETAQPVLQQIAQAAGGVPVALGALRAEGDRLRNALTVIDAKGMQTDTYDKHHLVPFGEYIPFSALAERLNIAGLAANGAGFEPGTGPRLLDFGAVGAGLPLICYEAVFAHGVNDTPSRPDFLLQVTNDAWFGQYAGPQQHLAQARMRAIEQGLPLMRSANTGITAMIDPRGRVVAQLPLNSEGFLDAPLPQPLAPTFYSKVGDVPVIVLTLLSVLMATLLGLRANRAVID